MLIWKKFISECEFFLLVFEREGKKNSHSDMKKKKKKECGAVLKTAKKIWV